MGYDITISREAFMWIEAGRPLLQYTREMIYALVATDPTLSYEADILKNGKESEEQGSIVYLSHPDPTVVTEGGNKLWYHTSGITAKYPDEHLIKKMADIAKRLNSFAVGDNGESYIIGNDGELIVDDSGENFNYVVGDSGRRYELDSDGRLANLNLIPDYLEENKHSFSKEDRDRFIPSSAPPPPPPKKGPKIYGLGTKPCEEFSNSHEQKKMERVYYYYTWYFGLITALNMVHAASNREPLNYETTDNIINEDIAFLYAFSKANPQKSFIRACEALIQMRTARQSASKEQKPT
ncbi:hypothetical protein AA0313_0455 [Acetobacter indonesiensis NRIC 0313]|uniref:Uncharacterized protein n=1 Tax=Acetobacter indonesiensis TaxID=104101 RepID=A0A252AVP2_9PROT|nr:hypothetical protein [Acetobacter indonesiensis]OUI94650.1 hypothetical protein HK17_03695 [Acetobacter indonesiensis]GAN62444.1 hypothetical protein Abin_007_134 [Acetobacter indonesiensis]GBQ54067.1 hypothetical protein AA0313_0455 [Acetobacter indonesiensis NRIC 0313]GEN03280.1 hypothetical protein AIN02nite_13050 [Acetobacter indonesiensis]